LKGIPGLSGFVAEMTIFFGAWQIDDTFHRVLTIIAISSIVITAVYILRVVGILLLGPIKNDHFNHLTDAVWYEKISTITLVIAIAFMGMAPFWLSDVIGTSMVPLVKEISNLVP
jgi:NADH-quinone oxidoreductase subunit M